MGEWEGGWATSAGLVCELGRLARGDFLLCFLFCSFPFSYFSFLLLFYSSFTFISLL